jgi:AraC-like DNA-binding protein
MSAEPIARRAEHIFAFDERASETPFVDWIWRTRSEPVDAFMSIAEPRWEIVVTLQHGKPIVTIRGAVTSASSVHIPQDADFFGMRFRLGAFVPALAANRLVDAWYTLPQDGNRFLWLDGDYWETPTFENADVFVDRLRRTGMLTRDPIVEDALHGERTRLSKRTLQRRIQRAVGITGGAVRQIQRATAAAGLLEDGATISDTAAQTGYSDPAHMSRSLRRFVGYTPGMLAGET